MHQGLVRVVKEEDAYHKKYPEASRPKVGWETVVRDSTNQNRRPVDAKMIQSQAQGQDSYFRKSYSSPADSEGGYDTATE